MNRTAYAGSMDYGDGFYDSDIIIEDKNENAPQDPGEPEGNQKKPSCMLRLLSVIGILIGILLIALGIWLIVVLSSVSYTDERIDHSLAEESGVSLFEKNGLESIMIFGEDNHSAGENGRSDTMILLTADKNSNKLKMTSFMRDLYLDIPGYGYDRLNAAYVYGGAKLACETIEANFGIRIDRYIIFDFEGFTAVIDSLGGIEVELTEEEIEYINWQSKRNHQTESDHELDSSDYSFHENENGDETALVGLSGRQALWYARDRDSAGSDFDRTQRQRTLIDIILKKLKDSDPISAVAAATGIAAHLKTNMDPMQLTGSGISLMLSLNSERKEFRVPTSDNYYDQWAGSSLVLGIYDTELECSRLRKFLSE